MIFQTKFDFSFPLTQFHFKGEAAQRGETQMQVAMVYSCIPFLPRY